MLEKAGFSLGRIIWDEGEEGTTWPSFASPLERLFCSPNRLAVFVFVWLCVCGFLKPCDTPTLYADLDIT